MGRADDDILRGTTLRVYRYLFASGKPAGIREIQRGLSLSAPSVAEYHLKKLLDSGLIKTADEGYFVDKIVWRNMVRMKRTLVPFYAIYSIFFSTALAVMLIGFESEPLAGYFFGAAIISSALAISLFETRKALKEDL